MDELSDSERRDLRRKVRAATLDALHAFGGEGRRDAIRDRALACGGFTGRELAAAAPEGAPEKVERLVVHLLAWELTNLKRDGLVDNPRWGVWRLAGAALEPPEYLVDDLPGPDRLAELQAMAYRDYLRTPEWRRTRAAALLRAGNRCAMDVTHDGALEVHHNSYERLGCELATDLVVLCRSCHALHHRQHGRPRRGPRPAPGAAPSPSPSPSIVARADVPSRPPPGVQEQAAAPSPRQPSLLRRLLSR